MYFEEVFFAGEMLDFIREGRSRSVIALKHEANREKERIVSKLRSRSRQRNHQSMLPSFLQDHDNDSNINERLTFLIIFCLLTVNAEASASI